MDIIKPEYNKEENVGDSYTLSQEHIDMFVQRKRDILEGKVTSRLWSEIKKDLENKIGN